MDTDLDIRTLATRLVTELGERAPPFSRMRWVELTASGQTRAALFWRDVLRVCEALLNSRGGVQPAAPAPPIRFTPRPVP